MPELPEVENVKLTLTPYILHRTIKEIILRRANLRYLIPIELMTLSKNAKVIEVTRIAKYLLLTLNNNHTIIVHLGMSGRLCLKPLNYQYVKHDHVILKLEEQIIVFNDTRRFGLIDIIKSQDINSHHYFARLGVEPLSENFSGAYLLKALKNRVSSIKSVIMDNLIVVGVGNIYASESLHLAKINPSVAAYKLNLEQLEILAQSIKIILKQAISAGGSTLKDYITATGAIGQFQNNFAVYGRDDNDCIYCNTEIIKIKIGGRSTFYCEVCQPLDT